MVSAQIWYDAPAEPAKEEWSEYDREFLKQVRVEIDESLLSRPKYNRGRRLRQVWVFSAVERATGVCFFEVVQDRSEATLLEVIKRRIRPGTKIMSDKWRAYCNLSKHGFIHQTVNHSERFVDDVTGAHTQTIESLWGALKGFLRGVGRNFGEHLEEYVAEFVYRRKHRDKLFDQFYQTLQDFIRQVK